MNKYISRSEHLGFYSYKSKTDEYCGAVKKQKYHLAVKMWQCRGQDVDTNAGFRRKNINSKISFNAELFKKL